MTTSFATLPHDPLTPLDPHNTPTPDAVRLLRRELYANAQAIPTTLGGGQFGHLGLIMPDAEFSTLSPTPYALPILPPLPIYDGATAVARDAMKDAYKTAMDTYVEAHAIQNHLKALILKAVPNLYISEFDDATMGYATTTPKQLLAHLIGTYGCITAKELEANLERIMANWNPDTPIETVFTNGTKCRQFAADGGDPISDKAYVRILVKIFRASGVLDKAVADWERKPETEQSVANALAYFKSENTYRLDEQKAMKRVLTANTAITNQRPAPTSAGTVDEALAGFGWGYCWTHGLGSRPSHKCHKPAEGHHHNATMEDRKGGRNTFWSKEDRRNPRRSNKAPKQQE
jgi:hypothetical protein